MGYSFEQDEPVAIGAKRIIANELAEVVVDLTDTINDDPAEAVHDSRKRLKKIRAVARLVRPALGDSYDAVNQHARDAARELSPWRDATALAKSFEVLAERIHDNEALAETSAQLASTLNARRAAAEAEITPDLDAVRRARDELDQLDASRDAIRFDEDGWDAMGHGLRRTYGRGRRGLKRSIESPRPEHFHEWRKRAKYTRHHMELLGPAAPHILDPLEGALHDLSDLLGDAHDLAVIGEFVRSDDPVVTRIDGVARIGVEVDARRAGFERRSVDLGRRLYAESPTRFTRRVEDYWNIWR
jgi:CHAD domain-containing protein